MNFASRTLLLTLALVCCAATNAFLDHDESEDEVIYSNSWAIEIDGDLETAQKIAEKHGFVHVGKVRNLPKITTNALVYIL